MAEAEKMQKCLDHLGINLTVIWTPDQTKTVHGKIADKILFIYDLNLEEAWQTFTHEAFEFKFRQVTKPYRLLVNELIGVIEKLTYQRKEEFLDFLPVLFDTVKTEKGGKQE